MRGGSIKGVIGELLGRQIGMSHGKGGSMHIFTPSFFGGNGIVGAQVPIGAGVSFAQKYMGEKTCTFALYGDGASNQGQVFEAFNMVRIYAVFLQYSECINLTCRLNYGTSLRSSFARTTSTAWVLPLLAVPPTPSTSLVEIKSLVCRSVSSLSRSTRRSVTSCCAMPFSPSRSGRSHSDLCLFGMMKLTNPADR